MMSDEMKEALREVGRYDVAMRREDKRHSEAVEREKQNHHDRVYAIRAALSPAAARIVAAAEGTIIDAEFPEVDEPEPTDCASPAMQADADLAKLGWTNTPPPPVPPGAMIEVPEKHGKRARP